MKTWDVEIEWVAVATVRVEAETQEQAQVLASERGLPWQEAGEGCDGSQTHYTATCVEDEDEPSECECDNTHEQNATVCRWCWAAGRRVPSDPDVASA